MKEIKKLLICVLMVCFLFGCSSPVQPAPVPFEKKLSGKYSMHDIQADFVFKEDGSVEVIAPGLGKNEKAIGTWKKVDNENISITTFGGTMTFTYIEEDNSITLKYGAITLTKE